MGEVLLTVDTATPAGSLALTQGETLLGEIFFNVRKRTHTDHILQGLDTLLEGTGVALDQVDAYAVTRGPGAFTGLRVGMATVKGLALAADRPLLGVSSLHSLAFQVPHVATPVCTVLDARKGEVYACLYRWQGGRPEPLMDEAVLAPEVLLSRLQGDVLFIGDGAVAYRTLINRQMGSQGHFSPWGAHAPRASSAAVLALEMFRRREFTSAEALVPHYIRPSEAEIMWEKGRDEASIEG